MHHTITRSGPTGVPRRRRLSRAAIELVFGKAREGADSDARLPRTGIHRVLVCRITHSLGNTLLLTPLLHEIQARYPGAEIDVLTRSDAAERIFGGFRTVRHVFRLPAHAGSHPIAVLRTLLRIRRTRYDLVIDPDRNSQTGRLLLLLARGDCKLGFSGEKAGALTHGVPVPGSVMHAGHLPVHLLRVACGSFVSRAFPPLDIELGAAERSEGVAALRDVIAGLDPASAGKPILGLFANATGHKFLGREWWQRFGGAIERAFPDHALVEIVPADGRSLLGERYPTYYSSDLRRLAAVLSGLSRLVSADCGIMHLACASGTPVTALFSVTDPAEWGPYGRNDRVVAVSGLTPQTAADSVARASRDAARASN